MLLRRIAKKLLRRPIAVVKSAVGLKPTDATWLKWLKRTAAVVVTVGSAVAAIMSTVIAGVILY